MRPDQYGTDACDRQGTRVSSLSLVRYRTNDYSVPVAYGHREVWIRGYVHEVVIGCGGGIIARPPRSYERDDMVFDPIHYLPLLEQKIAALDQAAPLAGWELPDAFPTLRRLLEARMGKSGKREYVQVLRLLETFDLEALHGAVKDALRLGAIGYDAVKHLVLCRIERDDMVFAARPNSIWMSMPSPACPGPTQSATPGAVPHRAPPAQTRSGCLSLPAPGQRGDHGDRQLYEPVGWRRVMTDTPQLLLVHHLKTLKLPTFLREYDKLARQGAAEGADPVRDLVRLAELELIDRERRMVERRIRQARFPAVKSLDSFDFKAIPSLNKMLVVELARCEYVERRENIIALGNSGTGKTHIALGLGLAACQKGLSVGFTTAAALVHELREARDEKRLLRFQKQLAKYSLLVIDELGFVPISKTGAELLFEVFSQRYERGATLVTSNLPFDEWTEIFGSERLTGALLDRLTHHVHILEMNGESYRLNQSQKRRKSPKPPA